MKTKNLIVAFGLFLCAGTMFAQNSTKADYSKLELAAWVPDQADGMPAAAKKNLENKLQQILIQNGMACSPGDTRFIISANVSVLTKDITATAPPMQAYTLNVVLYIGDGIEGKSYSSYSTNVSGVGENETKAYMNAMKNIKTTDPAYQAFVDKGKQKIVDYYETQCDLIIKEANQLATTRQYDQAIWKLTGVPTFCTSCWDKCMTALAPIYKQKIDYDCEMKTADATRIWNADQSWEGADRAGKILKTIDPKAACYKDAKALSDKIGAKIKEVDGREWNLVYEKEVGVQKDLIEAYKEVGVAYGKNQPQNITYKSLY